MAKVRFFFEIRDQEVVNSIDMVLIRKYEARGGGGADWNNFPKFVKRKASLHCVSLTIKFFLFEFVGFFGIDLGNDILDITYYEFLPLKFSVFERRPDKVS